ncbi:MAG: flagellar hook capping FlgD N-terminal domain-containing protein [Myxococcaceae bacterium]
MPDVTSTNTTAATVMGSTTPTTASAMGSSALGKDEFMKLLLAQLAQQDPTQPVDNQQFIAQLAQFSSVEQMTSMNQSMESLLVAQAGANQMQSISMVGKTVDFKSDHVAVSGGYTTIQGNLSGPAEHVYATLKDASGKEVGKIDCGASTGGNFSFSHVQALDSNGKPLPDGSYSVTLTASDANGKAVTVSSAGSGIVKGVSFSNGYAELLVGDMRIKLSDVTEIDQPPTTTGGRK